MPRHLSPCRKHDLLLALIIGALLVFTLVVRGTYMEKAKRDDILYTFPATGYISANESQLVNINSTVMVSLDDHDHPAKVEFLIMADAKSDARVPEVWNSVKFDPEVISCLSTASPQIPIQPINTMGPTTRFGFRLSVNCGFSETATANGLDELLNTLGRAQYVKITHPKGVELLYVIPEVKTAKH